VPVKAVATILNVLPYAVVSLEETNIRTAKDLEGKTLAITPGDGLTQTWPAVVAANKLNADSIKLIHMDPKAKIPAVTEKQAHALLGGADDQPIAMEVKGFKTRVLKFSDLGVPTVGFTVFAHQDTIKERPDLVRKVVAASVKGFEDAVKDPEAAVAALMKLAPLADREVVRRQLAVDLGLLFSAANKQKRVGFGPPEDWAATLEVLKKYRGVETSLPSTAFFTNEFLP
jgi:NitT/TauT family transport system substrate-binding protein